MSRHSLVLFAIFLACPWAGASELPHLAVCKVSGTHVWEPGSASLQSLLIDSSSPRVFAIALTEDDARAKATYNTYAHLNVRLDKKNKGAIHTDVQSAFGKPLSVTEDEKNPLHNTIRFGSRIGAEDLEVNITCTPYASSYVFLPTSSYDSNPLSSKHFVSTTVTNLLSPAGRTNFSAGEAQSGAEYLAANFCIAGSAEAAVAEMNLVRDPEAGLWRIDPANRTLLIKPVNFGRDSAGGISWGQRIFQMKCIASHTETYIDDDTGMPMQQNVCDKEIKVELTTQQIEIPACK